MKGKELFEMHARKWVVARGFPADAVPVASAVSRGKLQIVRDVRSGKVPAEVTTFAELHNFVDANYYGDAFEWPVLASETDDEPYQIAMMNFWNAVQDELNDWIVSGQMRASLRASPGRDRG